MVFSHRWLLLSDSFRVHQIHVWTGLGRSIGVSSLAYLIIGLCDILLEWKLSVTSEPLMRSVDCVDECYQL